MWETFLSAGLHPCALDALRCIASKPPHIAYCAGGSLTVTSSGVAKAMSLRKPANTHSGGDVLAMRRQPMRRARPCAPTALRASMPVGAAPHWGYSLTIGRFIKFFLTGVSCGNCCGRRRQRTCTVMLRVVSRSRWQHLSLPRRV
jgi:hypothetical protein